MITHPIVNVCDPNIPEQLKALRLSQALAPYRRGYPEVEQEYLALGPAAKAAARTIQGAR